MTPHGRRPAVPDDLARRLEAATVAYDVEWLSPPAARVPSPAALRMRRFGRAVAFAAPEAPLLDFLNRVNGLWPEDAGLVPEIAEWYRGLGLVFWAEIVPVAGAEALEVALESVGAERVGRHCAVWAETSGIEDRRAGLSVCEVSPAEVATVVTTLLDGHEVPREGRERMDLHSHWSGLAAWRFYSVLLNGEAAGAGVLRVGDGVGLLAAASTVPRFRGRGVQTALITRRLVDARAMGCEVVAAQAAEGSTSLRNLRRAGLRPAYDKTIWRLRPAVETP